MKSYKVYLHTKSGAYPPKDKWENAIFVLAMACMVPPGGQ